MTRTSLKERLLLKDILNVAIKDGCEDSSRSPGEWLVNTSLGITVRVL